jgi:hypothetical protein
LSFRGHVHGFRCTRHVELNRFAVGKNELPLGSGRR